MLPVIGFEHRCEGLDPCFSDGVRLQAHLLHDSVACEGPRQPGGPIACDMIIIKYQGVHVVASLDGLGNSTS